MNNFMKKFENQFINLEIIQFFNENSQLFFELDVSLNNQKPEQKLFISHTEKQTLTEPLVEYIGNSECYRFYDAVRRFYETAFNYYKK